MRGPGGNVHWNRQGKCNINILLFTADRIYSESDDNSQKYVRNHFKMEDIINKGSSNDEAQYRDQQQHDPIFK